MMRTAATSRAAVAAGTAAAALAALVVASPAFAIPDCLPETVQFVPGEGTFGMLMYEDLFPSRGDFDLNDLVVAYNWELHLDDQGRLARALLTLDPIASGGLIETGLALALPFAPGQLDARVSLDAAPATPLAVEANGSGSVLRVVRAAKALFGERSPIHVNHDPPEVAGQRRTERRGQTVLLDLRFATPVTLDPRLFAPGDLFLFHTDQPSVEVHLPSYPGTAAFDASLYGQADDASVAGVRYFVDHGGVPFALALPAVGPFPREALRVEQVYPRIVDFGATGGLEATDFYATPEATSALAVIPAFAPALPADHPRAQLHAGTLRACHPVPSVSSIAPPGIAAGTGVLTLTVNGADFAADSRVTLGGTALATTYVSASRLTAQIPAARLASATSLDVRVVSPSPLGDLPSNARPFTVFLVDVAVGAYATHVRMSDGSVWSVGANNVGQLGSGSGGASRSTGVRVDGIDTALQVEAGFAFACALLADGTVRCWGSNDYGQLGTGSEGGWAASPVAVTGLSGVTQLALGGSHACARLSSGALRCWGSNSSGQIGDNTTTHRSTPVTVSIGAVAEVSAGSGHTCARLDTGGVSCWGANAYGQLGTGSTIGRRVPTAVNGLAAVTHISLGEGSSCARLSGGTVRCWGYNSVGQLGDGTTNNQADPRLVSGITTAVGVSSSGSGACAVLDDGSARCWGSGVTGQLGRGVTGDSLVPVAVSNLGGVRFIAQGVAYHVCARLADGGLRCWGYNSDGQLGDGTTTQRNAPVATRLWVPTLTTLSPASVLTGLPSLALTVNGQSFASSATILLDGSPLPTTFVSTGQLSATVPGASLASVGTRAISVQHPGEDGGTSSALTLTVGNPVPSNATAIGAGTWYSCGVRADGTVWCAGSNGSGQLGDGTTTPSTVPVQVVGLTGVVQVSTGFDVTCARRTDRTLWCWGHNNYGQLGDGTLIDRRTPVQVGLTAVADVAVGQFHTCALRTDGTVWCWGQSTLGRIGNSAGGGGTPAQVVGINSAIAVTSNEEASHTCALLLDGGVRCWGENTYGQLGDGTTTNRSTPVAVVGVSNVRVLRSGTQHNCVIDASRNLSCWGRNNTGQLGDGATSNRSTPYAVTALAGSAVLVSPGGGSTCATRVDGNVWCWGRNDWGQVGDGTLVQRLSPVQIGLSGVAQMASGAGHTLALLTNGTVRAWGWNVSGQLFDRSTTNRSTPVTVTY